MNVARRQRSEILSPIREAARVAGGNYTLPRPGPAMPTCDCQDWNSRASKHLHWLSTTRTAWLHHEHSDTWTGWDADTAAAVDVTQPDGWQPWSTVCDDSEAPYVRWFCSALTNAAFNELDRHVLQVRPLQPTALSLSRAAKLFFFLPIWLSAPCHATCAVATG